MRRIAALLALAATLAACAPLMGPQQTPTDPAPARLSVATAPLCKTSPQCLRFEAGAAPATLRKVTISGTNLRVKDARCKVVAPDIVCTFNVEVPAGQVFALPVTGTGLFGQGEYARGGLGPYTASF